ncbi:MAG: LPS assembly protein LptD [Planctomycetota bacterium]
MRSERCFNERRGADPSVSRGVGRVRGGVVAVLAALALAAPALTQHDFDDHPLLASTISDKDVELRARWIRQWRDEQGTLILVCNGGFRLELGPRKLSANNAVIWIEPGRSADTGRKFYTLTVYLCEDAEVREAAGTVTLDTVLLVRGLRTHGQIIKYQDAYAAENLESSPLYQQALRDRLAFERGEPPGPPPAPVVARPSDLRPAVERPPRVIRYRLPRVEPAQTSEGERVFVATGGVYFSQAGGPDAAMLEIRAENAVVFPAPEGVESLLEPEAAAGEQETAPPTSAPGAPAVKPPASPPPSDERPSGSLLGLGIPGGQARLRAVYLEGDVILSLGNRFVRADRLYYDFEHDRAMILDAVFRADIPERQIPLYVRADEIRQLSAREFAADHAVVTTSEFFTPSYHVGAERVYVRDLTKRDVEGRAAGPLTGDYELKNATLNVAGAPLLWWPYSRGRLETSETLIRRVRTAYSSDHGFEFESAWYLLNLLGIQAPEGYDATLRLDYLTKRGPGVGIDADYEREDYYGLLRSYYLHDDGEDSLGPLRRRLEDPSTSERGRVLWRHRHYLPYDWEATLEAAYISDPHYMEEFEKSEWFEGKPPETSVYLKRARGVEALTFLANWRLQDFLTQTEHLPELAYRRIGDTFLSPVVLYHESRVGAVRYRTRDWEPHDLPYRLYQQRYTGRSILDVPGSSDVTFRTEARQETELPLKLGALNVVPFASIRGTYWDGQPRDDGGLGRGLGVYGVRGGTSFSRVYDNIESELFDVHRLRHIVQPQYAVWWGHSNVRSDELTPFDSGIETIDGCYGGMVGVRQTWQTKRGPADARRTVDLLTLNLEAGAFGDTDGRHDFSNGYANPLRPENSRTRNYVAGDLIHRLSDTTSLLYDFNVDMNDWQFDRHNVALAVERSPRLAYVFGWRYAGDIDMSLVGGGWNYKLTEKHITSVRAWYDIDTGELGEVAVAYVRKLPRWYLGLAFEYDNIDDDFTVSVSVWPEGIPEWTLGSRRFTGLATSTGIRP